MLQIHLDLDHVDKGNLGFVLATEAVREDWGVSPYTEIVTFRKGDVSYSIQFMTMQSGDSTFVVMRSPTDAPIRIVHRRCRTEDLEVTINNAIRWLESAKGGEAAIRSY